VHQETKYLHQEQTINVEQVVVTKEQKNAPNLELKEMQMLHHQIEDQVV
jgi:hypothetical protein